MSFNEFTNNSHSHSVNDYNSIVQNWRQPYSRDDLERQIATMQKQLQTVPLPGPTPDQLEKYPALKHAWEEFKVVEKLTMGEKQ